ncbi:hypothetical protein [Pseudoflavonifractor capillosus]|uniref:Uncharacterized protein n=1 Tax=Pseudoflavonifractor capillosus TaxID=106588 RepID=A0A921MJM7_9FIRM|nr:hypothetical protein [Pseudoflavonifractor capillosus]HJG85788.1 hypothetical protein [Pseudoflavonifractor capillosus]
MEQSAMSVLSKYFSTGTAAQERDFISDIFVNIADYQKIITPPSRSIRLLVGSKGSGKSALLEYHYKKCIDNKVPALYMTPIDIDVESFEENEGSSFTTQKIYKALIQQIAIQIGSELHGLITDEQEALVDAAVKAGARQLGALDTLIRVLSPIGSAITKVDFQKMLPDLHYTTDTCVEGINQSLQTLPSEDTVFYVLFDDIDQFGNPGNKNYIDIIWCAVLAFKKIAEKLPHIRPIITMRSEIWRRIKVHRQNLRDQVDHIRPMVYELIPSPEDMNRILTYRMQYCRKQLDGVDSLVFEPFFQGDDCKIPSSGERRYWKDYLVTSSRERPRDTVQLVHKLAENAIKHGRQVIMDQDVDETALSYSTERVDDLVNENSDLCPELETVIRSFSSVDFHPSADEVRNHLLRVPGRGRISIQSKTLIAQNIDDMYKLWNLLYEIEFLTPRAKDCTQPKGFTHIRPYVDPTLVSASRWTDMQKFIWEIHPCYRSYLINISNASKKMIGFPSTY